MKITVNTSAFEEAVQATVKKMNDARHHATQAGAQVLYDATIANVTVSGKGHYFHGSSFKSNGKKYFFNSGTLKSAIYQKFSAKKSTNTLTEFHVSWNHTKAPYGFMVEFGTKKTPAHSFLGKAINEHSDDAAKAMSKSFEEAMK
jgi:HK97 gp10 family phage protein